MNQGLYCRCGPAPEYETVSWIYVVWLIFIFQTLQDGINDYAFKVVGQHFGFLLGIACRPVGRILLLDLFLFFVLAVVVFMVLLVTCGFGMLIVGCLYTPHRHCTLLSMHRTGWQKRL